MNINNIEKLDTQFLLILKMYREQIGEEMPIKEQRYILNWVDDFEKLGIKDQEIEYDSYEECMLDYADKISKNIKN